ncbi:hypothetical protein [Pyramidobacter piscolens]|uniref:hypothetical protein n=1 Tax=Pyramidobacter piscolens TaxID=638849 RepID=UPI0026653883|nr:hypothetical protein [Pyramidobacter piscolens]
MKRLIALFIVVLCARSASATEIRTKALTVVFPETWNAEVRANDSVTLTSANGKTVITLTAQAAASAQEKADLDPRTVAGYLAEQLREGGAQASDVTAAADGSYSFTVAGKDARSQTETKSRFRFAIENGAWFVTQIVKDGDTPETERILRSIRYH